MKCHISSHTHQLYHCYRINTIILLTCKWPHSTNSCAHIDGPVTEQQSLSVYSSCWGSCLAFLYLSNKLRIYNNKLLQTNLWISLVAMGCRPSKPSDSVNTETNTSPLSLPMLVHQEALQAAVSFNFLHTSLSSLPSAHYRRWQCTWEEVEVAYWECPWHRWISTTYM